MAGNYSVALVPAGFHPTLRLSYDAPSVDCPLFARYRVPPAFIIDRFQLAQLHADHRLGSSSSSNSTTLSVTGERDLEAPVGRTGESIVVLRLSAAAKGKARERQEGSVELPLHVRYQLPVERRRNDQGERIDLVEIGMEEPVLFWACDASTTTLPPNTASCPVSSLPNLTTLFPPTTRLHFLSSHTITHCIPPPSKMLTLEVPTGVAADLPLVEISNFLVIWCGLIWVVWSAWSARRRRSTAGEGGKKKDE